MTERLAIHGGTPVRTRLLPYGRQIVDDADIAAVVTTLRSDYLTTGPEVPRFEEAFCEYVDARAAVAVSSGTAALHAAVFAAGVGPADEVITTPMTFAATANCARFQGATVIFSDVQHDTLNIDPDLVRKQITQRTKAIIAVDFTGQPSDLDELLAIGAELGVTVIEDAAHAFGATYRGRPVGSVSVLTTFSLHPVKHVTAGEGGIVTTNEPILEQRLRTFRTHGIQADARERDSQGAWYYEMTALGFNYRITDIQCSLGASQLTKARDWLWRRRRIVAQYQTAFSKMPELECPVTRPDRESAWHLYVLRLNLERLRVDRDQIFRALRAENIGVNVHYIPVPWHPYYQALGYQRGQWPIAENNFERMITLPLWPGMSDADVGDVVTAVSRVISAYKK